MGIYRGIGGTGDSTSDATLEAVTQKAVEADVSADAAAISETNAASSASSAQTYAGNASTSATAASSSAASAATSAATSTSSATTATTKASEAATSATNAASSATSAATSASTATTAKDAALAALDSFDDKYLGAKASDPSVDNDGNALSQGTLYYNTTSDVMKVYNGSVWVATYVSLSGALLASNNLSDVTSASSSRTNLGLGTIATQAANNVNITGGLISNITDLAVVDGGTGASTASGARTNLGLVIGTDVLAPNGSAASLTSFPTLNQNTTGTASNVTGTVAIANGGTGATTAGDALTALGAYAASNPSGYTSNTGTVTSVGGTGTVNGLSLSGTVTTSGNLTLGGTLDLSSPPAIGGTTPAAGTFTTLTATSTGTFGGDATAPALVAVASAGNTRWLSVTGSSAGNVNLNISGAGNGNLVLIPRGTGAVNFATAASATNVQMSVTNTASAVNYVQVTGAATTKATVVSSQGSDSNISSVFQSKGTGAIDLVAGSSGVNISNGGTVTAITRTAAGTGYTSPPAVAITAPTTAGGVQATATVNLEQTSSTSIIAGGGTGYTVNDVITVVGGTQTTPSSYTVTSVSGGVITSLSLTQYGSYSAIPSNPVSVTGGTGTGATLNITWQVKSAFTITNAGSGYVEQPTVSFSGGGGSGAAAYATVGSIPTLKTVGSALSFATPSGEAFRVSDIGTTLTTTWIETQGGTTTARLFANAASGNIDLRLSSRGTGAVNFLTNANQNQQFQVSHTASAVNSVQVTGAATGGSPTISVQGSDSNPNITLQSKGTGNIVLMDGGGNTGVRLLRSATSGDTFVDVQRNVGFVDFIVSSGVTNGDIRLTPKGTGNVRFGTYTASMALTVQGYIEIKDSGGTVRKLAVIA